MTAQTIEKIIKKLKLPKSFAYVNSGDEIIVTYVTEDYEIGEPIYGASRYTPYEIVELLKKFDAVVCDYGDLDLCMRSRHNKNKLENLVTFENYYNKVINK